MTFRIVPTVLGKRCFRDVSSAAYKHTPFQITSRTYLLTRQYNTFGQLRQQSDSSKDAKSATNRQAAASTSTASDTKSNSFDTSTDHGVGDWEHEPDLSISKFSELPSKDFGVNQHILINEEFKEALRQILWQFRAPIRYAFAYGSGVFPQSASTTNATTSKSTLHPDPPEAITKVQGGNQKMVDFIFGVSYSQHWHSLNLQQHRKHYSALGSLGSYAVSKVQDSIGAGCYFNPYITVNGTLIKYGVVNIDTLCRDLSEWDTLYLAGRLQKPVKILRDNPSVRLANQVNLISAVRTALLLLPEEFTEADLYGTIAGISYMGDPRMSIGGDDPRKVQNIVSNQIHNFRRLYAPLIDNLPNMAFNDPVCSQRDWYDDPSVNARITQNMDPVTRGHMVRRLPKAFREKLYFEYQAKFKIPRREFNQMLAEASDEDPERIRRREGGPFERRIAEDTEGGGLRTEVSQVIEKTIRWPSFTQSIKGIVTAGFRRSWQYAWEKRKKATSSPTEIAQETKDAEKKQS